MSWLGLDIGGANLKAAHTAGWASSHPFPLWRNPGGLADALAALIEDSPTASHLAVTMTGELCDCFRTKEEGVRSILSAVKQIAADRVSSVFLVDGQFVDVATAWEAAHLAAASNWRALADFVRRFVPTGTGLLVDVGSTTSDIIPIVDGRVAAQGATDLGRLATGELVYGGVGRTPVCAVIDAFPWLGRMCPVAAEVFSTTADAYVLLGDVDEDREANWTADGRALTVNCARQRLARQLCADSSDFGDGDFDRFSRTIADSQLAKLIGGISTVVGRMPRPPEAVVVSGLGEFLARRAAAAVVADIRAVSLAERLGAVVSQCATAYALAILASESTAIAEQSQS